MREVLFVLFIYQNMLTLLKMNVMDLDALTHGTHKVIIK